MSFGKNVRKWWENRSKENRDKKVMKHATPGPSIITTTKSIMDMYEELLQPMPSPTQGFTWSGTTIPQSQSVTYTTTISATTGGIWTWVDPAEAEQEPADEITMATTNEPVDVNGVPLNQPGMQKRITPVREIVLVKAEQFTKDEAEQLSRAVGAPVAVVQDLMSMESYDLDELEAMIADERKRRATT